jgi:hypothetical protein
MPKVVILLAALLFSTLPGGLAYSQNKVVVFAGYSYVRSPVTVEEDISSRCTEPVCPANLVLQPPITQFVTPRLSLNGWEVSGTYRFLPWLGATADFGGYSGAAVRPSNAHQHTYLFGPEISLPRRVAPFAHLLVGAAHESVSAVPVVALPLPVGEVESIPGRTSSSFSMALGGGIDLKLSSHFWLRPVQVDYLLTRFGSATQNQPRISTGLVFEF